MRPLPHKILIASHRDREYRLRCYSLSRLLKKIKLIVFAGTIDDIRACSAVISDRGRFWFEGDKDFEMEPDLFEYSICSTKTIGRGYAVVAMRSYDPRCLWDPSHDTLYKALMHEPFETPLLPRWMPAFRAALVRRKMLLPMEGWNQYGEILEPTLSPKILDNLASKGVSEKKLSLK